MSFDKLKKPDTGETIQISSDGKLNVGDNPIIPFIEGDGIGIDITPAMKNVLNSAVEKAYGGKKKINWFEV
ncbi:MAG: NADP-dependent isocitrate dehydrogenase, partial [Balneolaceae bacterium]